jgi:quercetin dioxygenase-like cupin family protein
MGIIRHEEREKKELAPGVIRQAIVGRDTGAGALTTSYVSLAPGAKSPIHHHKIEEAMLVIAGQGLAVVNGESMPIKAGETLLSPAGETHGFINTGSVPMIVSGIFPTVDVEVILDE